MRRSTRAALSLILLALCDCATAGISKRPHGELVLGVRSVHKLGWLRLVEREHGWAFDAEALPEGESVRRFELPAGDWCLAEWSLGVGSFGTLYRVSEEISACVPVREDEVTYLGYLSFDDAGGIGLEPAVHHLANQSDQLQVPLETPRL